jgi:hypothetical protein
MSHSTKAFLGLCVLLACTSCQTTGDPNRGGIFWSERKANERLDDRRGDLGAIEADTARVKRKNEALEDAAERKRRFLAD